MYNRTGVKRVKPGILIVIREWLWLSVTNCNWTLDLDLGHLPDTQRYLGLLSEPCTPIQTF